MRGLLIREPWITKIFDREKTWELRSRNTHMRGTIVLLRAGSKLAIGTVNLVDVIALPERQMRQHKEHGQTKDDFGKTDKVVYAGGFKDARRFKKPVRYRHPYGAVIWVRLSDAFARGR